MKQAIIVLFIVLLLAGGAHASNFETFFSSAQTHHKNRNLEAAASDFAKAAATTNDPFVAAPALAMHCLMLSEMNELEKAARACNDAAGRIPVNDGRTAGLSAISMYNTQWALYALGKYDDAIAVSKQIYASHMKAADPRAYDLVGLSILNRAFSLAKLGKPKDALDVLSELDQRQWPILQDGFLRSQYSSVYAGEVSHLRLALLSDLQRTAEVEAAAARMRESLHSTRDPEHRDIGSMLRLCEAFVQHNTGRSSAAQDSIDIFYAELERNRRVDGQCYMVSPMAAQLGQFCGVPIFTATYPSAILQYMQQNGTGPGDLTGAIIDYAAGRYAEALGKVDKLTGVLHALPKERPLEAGIKRLEHLRRIVLENRCPSVAAN